MRLIRRTMNIGLVLCAATLACDSGFLDPELAGSWGGENLEVTIEADQVRARLICDNIAYFPGSVRLGEQQEFQREGRARGTGNWYDVVLTAHLVHADTLMAMVYNPDPLADPLPPVPLVRGRPAAWNALILCA